MDTDGNWTVDVQSEHKFWILMKGIEKGTNIWFILAVSCHLKPPELRMVWESS